MTTPRLRRFIPPPSVPVAPFGGIRACLGPRDKTRAGRCGTVGGDSPRVVEHIAVGQAGPQTLGTGSQVRRLLARRRTGGRAPGALARASRYCDGACRHPPASRVKCHGRATEGRSRSRGRRRWLQIDRSAHPAPPARRLGSAAVSRSHPGGHRSVIWPNTSCERGRGGDIALCHRPLVFRPRAWASSEAVASPCNPERSFRRILRSSRKPRLLANARPTRLAWRTPLARSTEPKSAVLSPGWKSVTQERGRFRTLNWTPNPENRPQRERKAAAGLPQDPPISR